MLKFIFTLFRRKDIPLYEGDVLMKHTKMIPKYEAEINKLAEEHLMALFNLSATSFHDGAKVGQRNALFAMSIGLIAGIIGLTIAGVEYLEHKEQP